MNGEMTCRKATLADRDAVLAIHDNVYEGSDYLPAYYNSYIQSKSTHCYLAEQDGKVVSFLAYLVTDKGKSVISGAARTHRDYQRRGISTKLEQYAAQNVKKLYPHMEAIYYANNKPDHAAKIEAGKASPGTRLLRRMKFLVYLTSHQALATLARCDIEKAPVVATISPKSANESPKSANEAESFLISALNRAQLFHEGVVKYLAPWFICSAEDDDNLKMAVRSTNVVITTADRMVSDNNLKNIQAVSFGSACSVPKYLFRYDLDLFVDKNIAKDNVSVEHIINHARHACSISKPGDQISLFLCLPWEVDLDSVKQSLMPHLGANLCSDYFNKEDSFIYATPISTHTSNLLFQ